MWAFGLLLLLLLGVNRPQPHLKALKGGSPSTLAYARSLLHLPSSQAYVAQVQNPCLSILWLLLPCAPADALQGESVLTSFKNVVSQVAYITTARFGLSHACNLQYVSVFGAGTASCVASGVSTAAASCQRLP